MMDVLNVSKACSSETPITWSPPQENSYEVDYEKHGANRDSNPMPDLKRKLKSRHLQMIAIGKSTIMKRQTYDPC